MLSVSSSVKPHLRRTLQSSPTWGTCSYTNAWTGSVTCDEYRGSTWNYASAGAACQAASSGSGTLAAGATCTVPAIGGWCHTNNGTVATPMGGATCAAARLPCVSFAGGTFEGVGTCAGGPPISGAPPSGAPPSGAPPSASAPAGGPPLTTGGPARCTLAPGPIGAAHQLGFSPGYDHACPGTPAEGSPYAWPLAWTAENEWMSLKYRSDEVQWRSSGQVYYRLDKNWKRSDVWFQNGTQRMIGQSPCDAEHGGTPVVEPDGSSFACLREPSFAKTTMLHRGNKMVFISYDESGENITQCSWLDMAVIGNVRPDWFMDLRGDSTDVQYLGDEHVFYQGKPALVKKWRKRDFASQYFTMSMQEIPGRENVHWPLILNIPGEGFGDDSLQRFDKHRVLTDDDDHLFLLDEAFVAQGGSCPMRGDGSGGPPALDQPVLSNLEIEDSSWRSIEYTYSPVWVPPPAEVTSAADAVAAVEIADGVSGTMCAATGVQGESLVRVRVTMDMEAPVWAAIGFRQSEVCEMTPRQGGDGEALFAGPDENGIFALHYGPVQPELRAIRLTSAADPQPSRRALDDHSATPPVVWGTCSYTNVWTGSATCDEYRGSTWDVASAGAACGSGTLAAGATCAAPEIGGWCHTNDGTVATPFGGATCAEARSPCVTFARGAFEGVGTCAGSPPSGAPPSASAPSTGGAPSTSAQSATSTFYRNLQPAAQASHLTETSVTHADGKLTIAFTIAASSDPLHLNYAFGHTPGISYHASRGCFDVPRALAACGTGAAASCPATSSSSSTPTFQGEMTTHQSANVATSACFEEATSSLRLTATYQMPTPAWAAIGFRDDEECRMNPEGGGDGEVLYADAASGFAASFGPLPADVRSNDAQAVERFMASLGSSNGTGHSASSSYEDGVLTLRGSRTFLSRPCRFFLTQAVGAGPSFGSHNMRRCFSLAASEVPTCAPAATVASAEPPGAGQLLSSSEDSLSSREVALIVALAITASMLIIALILLGKQSSTATTPAKTVAVTSTVPTVGKTPMSSLSADVSASSATPHSAI